MWIVALVSSAIMLPGLPTFNVTSEEEGYNACIYECTAVCGSVYTDVHKCDLARLKCKKNCIVKYPTQFKGCNKGWKPTAKGCECIQPLLANGICPKAPPPAPPPIAADTGVKAQGRVKTGGQPSSNANQTICQMAGQAKARNSPAAVGLIAQCLTTGGKPIAP
jgi:hypothetical protein